MPASQKPRQSLQDQLEALRSIEMVSSAQRVLDKVEQRARRQQRQVIAAVFGACVAAVGVLHFVQQGDLFASISLIVVTTVLIFVARSSARIGAGLTTLESGDSLLTAWCRDLKRQLRDTTIAQLGAASFAVLTIGILRSDGLLSLKSLGFLVIAAVVCTFAVYQRLVLRPALLRELKGLKRDE